MKNNIEFLKIKKCGTSIKTFLIIHHVRIPEREKTIHDRNVGLDGVYRQGNKRPLLKLSLN